MIPYGRQEITQLDIDAVVEVLKSDHLTQGPAVPAFEADILKIVGANYAVAVNSATSALHIACLALDVQKKDLIWTSAITFVASANCALYCGAQVDFVDIDPKTYNICLISLEKKLINAKRVGKLPKIVIVVHLCGQPSDLAGIHRLSQLYGFKIIEDASHAIGAKYKDESIGSCQFSDITIFSFHPVKIITTAEGGIAITNSEVLAKKMSLSRSHGVTRNPLEMKRVPDGPWYYEQIDLGFNYRMTELQAALGISQLKRLEGYVQRRNELAQRYNLFFQNLPITLPWVHADNYSSFHLYVIRLNLDKMRKSHIQVFEAMRANGIGVNLHYIPVYRHPYYQAMGFNFNDFPNAEKYYSEAISLPIFQSMTFEQQDAVINTLEKVL